MKILSHQDIHTPVYNIKAISRLTNLPAVTLRAWERRYGLPQPKRGEQGYRLYSEHDLSTVRWLKTQVENGLAISRAAEHLFSLRRSGNDPVQTMITSPARQTNPGKLAEKLFTFFVEFDSNQADALLDTAYEDLPAEDVLENLITPVMRRIGEGWHKGEIPIAVEHLASQLVMHKLHRWTGLANQTRQGSLIMAACAPHEQHQIGMLMLILLLRQRGWDARFFGTDLAMEGIGYTLSLLQPQMVLLSATLPENAKLVSTIFQDLKSVPEPKPVVVLGGSGFQNLPLPAGMPGVIINLPLIQSVEKIEDLLVKTVARK